MASGSFDKILREELIQLEGIQHQNPETGAGINEGTTYISQYTNRIFGAPFQLMDSVDRRFENVNKYVGNEYLRNFILNSPILHIKPGMPKYTGGTDSSALAESIKSIYVGTNTGMGFVESLLTELAGGTVFSSGSKLQKRMYGFRETYYQYMSHVNYMCRSMAVFLNLTSSSKYPNGTFTGTDSELTSFADMQWENYRMLRNSHVNSPYEQLSSMASATLLGASATIASTAISETLAAAGSTTQSAAQAFCSAIAGNSSSDVLNQLTNSVSSAASGTATTISSTAASAVDNATDNSVIEIMSDKICSVMFMVEPVSFQETLSNTTKTSMIESSLDSINTGVGSEIAFITNSKVDLGLIEGVTDFLGDTVSTAANFLTGLTEPVAGGFTSNLFNGALQTIKGQKMIYPKIYSNSESHMDYEFTVNLTTPYGDVYNYYMNIVVPLMHLIALAAPRMVTSNSVASPFLVQAFIPGMCTCQLGIISQMSITKNQNAKHVSVHGYPLDVTVKFTIEELYNALSISPANDPASFLFNETLNDYMSNLAGLQPSVQTYTNQRIASFQALQHYFSSGDYLSDVANDVLTKVEDTINPYG